MLSFGGGELARCLINEAQERTSQSMFDSGMMKRCFTVKQLARTTSRISMLRLVAGTGVMGAFHPSLRGSAEVSVGKQNLRTYGALETG